MVDLSNFCKPSEEMDDIARKMRAGEAAIDYKALFDEKSNRRIHCIKPEQEGDASAVSMRLQSECRMSVEEANAVAYTIHPRWRMPEL